MDVVYLGGGYPELYATALAANQTMCASIADAHRVGKPVFAECGGFMYLCERLIDITGMEHKMDGLIPGIVRMETTLQSIGYRDVALKSNSALGSATTKVRGHEFRYSRLEGALPPTAAPFATGETAHGYSAGSIGRLILAPSLRLSTKRCRTLGAKLPGCARGNAEK